MYPQKNNHFFQNKDGLYVAWPLYSPARPDYGDWCFVKLASHKVTFVRDLSPLERLFIETRFMVWGMKLASEPWALAMGSLSEYGVSGYSDSNHKGHTIFSIGV